MAQHDTGVQCPVCKQATIVAEVESVSTESSMNIPIGPGSRNYYHLHITSFHCSHCQIVFYHPPGKPEIASEILCKAREEAADDY